MWITQIIDILVYDKQGDILVSPNKTNNGLISLAMGFMKVLFGKNGVFATGSGVYNSLSNLLGNLTGTNSTTNLKRMMDPAEYSIKPFARNAFGSIFSNITTRFLNTTLYQKMGVVSTRRKKLILTVFFLKKKQVGQQIYANEAAVRFLMTPVRVFKRIQHRTVWNALGQPADWRYGLEPPGMIVLNETYAEAEFISSSRFTSAFMPGMTGLWSQEELTRKRAIQETDYPFQFNASSNFFGVTFCSHNKCLNCTLLEDILDTYLDLISLCVYDAIHNGPIMDGSLRQDSIDLPVIASIDPGFWDGDKRSTYVGPRSSLSKWAVRPSLHRVRFFPERKNNATSATI